MSIDKLGYVVAAKAAVRKMYEQKSVSDLDSATSRESGFREESPRQLWIIDKICHGD